MPAKQPILAIENLESFDFLLFSTKI
ncbi:hypothetical protein BSG1_21325 [Bacillus sp. SG-1]|nr:hypothetical protein BSG1_21325 [Bacillus sp. SG-1]